MGYIIDVIYAIREIIKLSFMVITSPMGIIASLLFLDNNSL